jgi:hypothetical protein
LNCSVFGSAYVFSTLAAAVDTLFPGPEGVPILVVDQNFNPLPADPNNPNPMTNLGAPGVNSPGAAGFITQTEFVPPAYPVLFTSFPSQSQTKNIIDIVIYTLDQLVLAVNGALVIPQIVQTIHEMIGSPYPGCPPECPPELIQAAEGLVFCKNCTDPQNPVLYAFKDLPYGDTSEVIIPAHFLGAGMPPAPTPTGVYRAGRYTIMHYMDRPELLGQILPVDTVVKAKALFEALYFFTAFDYYSELCNIVPSGYHPNGLPIYERNKDGSFNVYPKSPWDRMKDVKSHDLEPYYPNSYDRNYYPEATSDYEGLKVKMVDNKRLKWVK